MRVESFLRIYTCASVATLMSGVLCGIWQGISTAHKYNNISSMATHIYRHCVKQLYEAAIICIFIPLSIPMYLLYCLYLWIT